MGVEMVRTVLALSDPDVGRAFRRTLDGSGDCTCVGATHRLDEVRPLVADHTPDVLVLDVAFRRADPGLLPELVNHGGRTAVLVYVDHGPEDCAIRHLLERQDRGRLSNGAVALLDECCLTSLKQDARGCVARGTGPDGILRAVRAVAAGQVAPGPWLTAVARRLQGPNAPPGPNGISPRELEVMVHLGNGLSDGEIAGRLGICEQTVKNHVSRTMAKLGLGSRDEVGRLAAEHRLRLED
jgi:DNA-binding NarL/FixJ family response regulator